MKISKKQNEILLFLLGILSCFQVRIFGVIGIGEILGFLAIPFVYNNNILKNKPIIILLFLLLLWLIGSLFSDIINNTKIIDSIKWSGTIICLFLDIIIAQCLLKDNVNRILYYLLGFALSNILVFYFVPSNALATQMETIETSEDLYNLKDVWFNYYISPIVIFISSLLYYKKYNIIAYITMELFAIYTLFHLSRHIFLVWSVVVFTTIFIGKINTINQNNKIVKYKRNIKYIVLCIVIIGYAATEIYQYSAYSGFLGEKAYNKYMIQKNEEGGLLSGRSSFFDTYKAITHNPLIGYGSYSRAKINIDNKIVGISKHSHILGAWAYSGIFGLFFWIYVLFLLIKFLYKYILYNPHMILYSLISSISLIWDILFSPLSVRLSESMTIVFFALIINNINTKKI